ncbi:MAG: homoserine kinase [Flavobacteriaceae bacterium]
MAQYTVLNDTSLQTILNHYGIEKVKSYKILSGGSENTNYVVKTEDDSFVLTICEQKSLDEAERLALLLEYLKFNNFSTSKIVKTNKGALTFVWNDKPVMIKEFIEGNIHEDLTEGLLEYLGMELAKLHQIEAPEYLPKSVNYGLERFDIVKTYAPESSFYSWLKSTQEYIESYISTDLPKALIHSDIFYNNIIVDEKGGYATIMDFEEASNYYRLFDIGMMIVGTCNEDGAINLNKATCLLKGYQQEVSLLIVEQEALQVFVAYGATATAFWRHQNFNYVNVDETMANHYKAMKTLADSVMNIPRDEFKKLFNYLSIS